MPEAHLRLALRLNMSLDEWNTSSSVCRFSSRLIPLRFALQESGCSGEWRMTAGDSRQPHAAERLSAITQHFACNSKKHVEALKNQFDANAPTPAVGLGRQTTGSHGVCGLGSRGLKQPALNLDEGCSYRAGK